MLLIKIEENSVSFINNGRLVRRLQRGSVNYRRDTEGLSFFVNGSPVEFLNVLWTDGISLNGAEVAPENEYDKLSVLFKSGGSSPLLPPEPEPTEPEPEPEPELPDYVDINGIRLKRTNETEGGVVVDGMTYYTHNEAATFQPWNALPNIGDWNTMLATGYTWDDDLKGIWMGANHAMKKETEFSTFLPAAGRRPVGSPLILKGVEGLYWGSGTDSYAQGRCLSFTSRMALTTGFNSENRGSVRLIVR